MQSGGSAAFPPVHLAPAAAAASRTVAPGPPTASNSNIGYLPAAAPPRSSAVAAAGIAPAPMPVPLAPYPPQPQMMPAPPGAQGQLLCSGCRTLLLYPQGASNVRCALCSSIMAVSPHGADVAQLICGGCRTLLMYARGATSVQCSCCNTVNLAMEANQIAHVNCGGCGTLLMYPYGAQSVKCALCQFVNSTGMSNNRMPLPAQRPAYVPPPLALPASQPISRTQTQTVVVENPMTLDESGKLVSNVAVGVTTEKKCHQNRWGT